MAKFTIPIIETVEHVYIVEARSATEAGIVLGADLAANPELPAQHVRRMSRKILSAKRLIPDEQTVLDTGI